MDRTKKILVLLILVLAGTSGWLGYVLASPSPSINRIATSGNIGPCTWFVSLDGTTPVAEAMVGGLSVNVGDNVVGTVGQDVGAFINSNVMASGVDICLAPNTSFTITAAITVNVANVIISGGGRESTTLSSNSATNDVITVSASFVTIKDLTISSSVTKTGGAGIRITGAIRNISVVDVKEVAQWINVWTTHTVSAFPVIVKITNDEFINTVSEVVRIDDGNDIFLSNNVADAPSGSQPTYGLHITASSGIITSGVFVSDTDFIHAGTPLQIDPASGGTVEWLFLTGFTGDSSSGNGWNIGGGGGLVYGVTLVNSWSASNSLSGVLVGSGVSGLRVDSSKILNNVQHGVLINAGANITISNSDIAGNSANSHSTYHGISIAAGVSFFTIEGNRIGSFDGFSSSQGWGILVNTGASNWYMIVGNMDQGNITGAISDNGTGVNKVVANNL